MKKNKVIFLATEIILCVLALFFTFKMFDQNETEKKVEKESKLSKKEKLDLIDSLTKEMKSAASNLDFERAMELRDIIFDLENDK